MTAKQSVIEQLRAFVVNGKFPYNAWLGDRYMKVYVRCSKRLLPGSEELVTVLDVASLEIGPRYRRRGRFKNFIEEAHAINPWYATFVECVHNPVLVDWFTRQPEWRRCGSSEDNNFYRLK